MLVHTHPFTNRDMATDSFQAFSGRYISTEVHEQLHSSSDFFFHSKCSAVNCLPFGKARSCAAKHLISLSNIVDQCFQILPQLTPLLLLIAGKPQFEAVVALNFPFHQLESDETCFVQFTPELNRLQDLIHHLSPLSTIQQNIILCLKQHDRLPSEQIATRILAHLSLLQELLLDRFQRSLDIWCARLDTSPDRATKELMSTVMFVCFLFAVPKSSSISLQFEARQNPDIFPGQLPFISLRNFESLGPRRWLDDEIINYFVEKWCARSNTIGFNTFFATRFLFQTEKCLEAKSVITCDDRSIALKWCRAAVVSQISEPSIH